MSHRSLDHLVGNPNNPSRSLGTILDARRSLNQNGETGVDQTSGKFHARELQGIAGAPRFAIITNRLPAKACSLTTAIG